MQYADDSQLYVPALMLSETLIRVARSLSADSLDPPERRRPWASVMVSSSHSRRTVSVCPSETSSYCCVNVALSLVWPLSVTSESLVNHVTGYKTNAPHCIQSRCFALFEALTLVLAVLAL